MGITTAMVSRKAVVSHWAALASIEKASMRRGRATLMSVSLRMTTKVEISSSVITSLLRAPTAEVLSAPAAFSAVLSAVFEGVMSSVKRRVPRWW